MKGESKLGPTAKFMLSAVQKQGIETQAVRINVVKHLIKSRLKIPMNSFSFKVNGKEYCYGRSALLRRENYKGKDCWVNVNHNASLLCADKYKTKLHLAEKGFSTPKGQLFRRRNIQPAYDFFKTFSGGSVCVKPNNGLRGNCVFAGIQDFDYYQYAINKVMDDFSNVLIENSVSGRHFRFFYVYPKVVGVREGVIMNVKGNGESTITELIDDNNEERICRGLLATHPVFKVTDEVSRWLASQNLSVNYIPQVNETIYLESISNYTHGSRSVLHALEDIDPSYLDIVEKACQSVPGLFVSGVDIIIKDLATPADENNQWLIELNTNSDPSAFYHPWEGETVDIAGYMLEMLINNPDLL